MDLTAAVAVGFGLDARTSRPLAGGTENSAYFIETPTGAFVVLALTRRTPASASTYASYVSKLARAGLPTPAPLAAVDGGFVVIDGGTPLLAFPYVAGESPSRLDDIQLGALGGVLADVHLSGVDCPLPPHLRFSASDLALAATADDAAFGDWVLAVHDDVAGAVTELAAAATAPTHGDPFPDNLVVSVERDIVLLDWEDGARDTPLIDVGMALLGHCNNHGLDAERARVLIDAYRLRSGLDVDGDALLAVTTYSSLFTALNRYRRRAEAWTQQPDRSHEAARRFVTSLPATWPDVFSVGRGMMSRRAPRGR